MGLFSFLFGGGQGGPDGASPETAVVVNSVGEEYKWIARRHPGFQPQMQAVQQIDGKPYDVLSLRNDRGEERKVYFDISRFYGRF